MLKVEKKTNFDFNAELPISIYIVYCIHVIFSDGTRAANYIDNNLQNFKSWGMFLRVS